MELNLLISKIERKKLVQDCKEIKWKVVLNVL